MAVKKYKYYLAFFDFLVLSLSAFFFIFYNAGANKELQGILSGNQYSEMVLFPFVLVGLVILLVSESSHLYKPDIIYKGSAHNNAIVKVVLTASAGLVIFIFLLVNQDLLNGFMVAGNFAITALLLLYLYRVKIVAPLMKTMAANNYNILVVGDPISAKELSSKLMNINSGMSLAGYVQRGSNGNGSGEDIKYLGSINHLNRVIREKNIRELVIAHSDKDYSSLFELVETCKKEKLPIKIQSPLFSVVEQKLEAEKLGGVNVISLNPPDTFYTRYGKRILDIIGAAAGLILMLPLFAVLAVLIKATSPGPVFFKQPRVGKNGREFLFYKFRSMYQVEEEDKERAEIMKEFINKEKIDSEDAKVVNTARVTKIGKIIRKTSIDELPQFYNVLKGDMSLVGPRPEVPYVFEMYKDWQRRRVAGVPGCTGVWQVTARSKVTFNEMVMLDIYYLNNVSFALDLTMILKTIPVMFFSKGGR